MRGKKILKFSQKIRQFWNNNIFDVHNDIDTIDDWKRAEFMFQILNNKNRVK